MTLVTAALLATLVVHSVCGAALKYDQRQDGEVNVRADLENFVILIIPSSTGSGLSLLDLVAKAIPRKSHKRKHPHKAPGGVEAPAGEESVDAGDQETKHFIEAKSAAPYHVDISRTRNHLAKLHPEIIEVPKPLDEAILISPTISLAKDEVPEKEVNVRLEKAFEIPSDFEVKHFPGSESAGAQLLVVPSNTVKAELHSPTFKDKKVDQSEELLLLGDTEQCGPGRKRDKNGVCQFRDNL